MSGMEKPIYAVGDIHGRYEELKLLLKDIAPKAIEGKAKIVFLGDYSGYGLKAMHVMRYIYKLKYAAPENTIVLAGNWEDMLSKTLFNHNRWMEEILESRGAKPLVNWIRQHDDAMQFVESFMHILETAHVDGNYVFSHAGVSRKAFKCKSGEDAVSISLFTELVWQPNFFLDNRERTHPFLQFVTGHTPIQFLSEQLTGNSFPKVKPYTTSNIIVADFGSCRKSGFLGYVKFSPNGERGFHAIPVILSSNHIQKSKQQRKD